jgi:hypothetical protein
MTRAVLLLCATACGASSARAPAPAPSPPPVPPVSLESLTPQREARGFVALARYLDHSGRPTGARFRHRDTGFILDALAIESAPQAMIWVNSLPTSSQGEPHTQEHLLLGKGSKGRTVANLEEMLVGESSAFTDQHRTCYHLHTAGEATFWPLLRASLDGLLDPDYTDEEIRREVRHFGVTERKDGSLVLEEKGTVYNEMVRTYEQALALAWRAAETLVYGDGHPLALSAGGWPADIRTMSAEDIRAFHAEHYHLGNMGVILSVAPSTPLDEVLARTDEILDALAGRTGPVVTEADVAPPDGADPGQVRVVDYPTSSASRPSPVLLVWPATRELSPRDAVMLELFLDAMAGDESTELYKLLVDSKTRSLDTGATGVWSFLADRRGHPVIIGLSDVPPRAAGPAELERVRAEVVAALRRAADAPDGGPALAELNARVASRGWSTAAGSSPRRPPRRRASASGAPTPSGWSTSTCSPRAGASTAR